MQQRVGITVGGGEVGGLLYLPGAQAMGGAVVLGGRLHDLEGASYLADAISAAGVAALRIAYRDPDDFASALPEVAGAVRLLRAHPAVPQRIAVVGHSYGAAVAAVAAGRDSRIRAAILLAPPAERDYFGALRPMAELSRTRAKVLIVVPGSDEVVPPEHGARYATLLRQGGAPHRLITIDGADHEFLDPAHRSRVVEEVTGWLRESLA